MTGYSEQAALLRYVESAGYSADFHTARAVWASPGVLGGAGMVVFATYATLPSLTSVGSTSGEDALMLRRVAGVRREKQLLVGLFGLTPEHPDGLANPAVRSMLTRLGHRHRGLRGMRPAYLDLVAGLIAISPLRVRTVLGLTLAAEDRDRYWRYMRYALKPLGAELGAPESSSRSCGRFIARNTGAGPRTKGYLAHLLDAYPEHMRTAKNAMFPATRRVICSALGSELVADHGATLTRAGSRPHRGLEN